MFDWAKQIIVGLADAISIPMQPVGPADMHNLEPAQEDMPAAATNDDGLHDPETSPLSMTKGETGLEDLPATVTNNDHLQDQETAPLSMTRGAVYMRMKRLMESEEVAAQRRLKNAERDAMRRRNWTLEQRQQESLKRRAARVRKSRRKTPAKFRALGWREECGQPTVLEMNAASDIVRAALMDKSKDCDPLLPIYTFNADDEIAQNSIFVRCQGSEIFDGATVRSWKIDRVGAAIPKSFIISPTKTRPFFILCDVTEIAHIDGVLLVGHGSHAVLLCATYNCNKSIVIPKPVDIRDDMRTFKANIVEKKPHYGSSGECFSFGDHASFCKVTTSNQSSIGPYSSGDVWKERHYGAILLSLIRSAQNGIDDCLPGFSTVCALTMDVMLEVLNGTASTVGIPSPSCSGNYLAAHFNFNASTSRFHIERDTSYTLMLVPWGCSQDNLQLQFHFRLNDASTVMIGMRAGVTFTFAAYLLTHRQHCSASDYDCCLNCSTYGNKQLFQHARTTYIRMCTSGNPACVGGSTEINRY